VSVYMCMCVVYTLHADVLVGQSFYLLMGLSVQCLMSTTHSVLNVHLSSLVMHLGELYFSHLTSNTFVALCSINRTVV